MKYDDAIKLWEMYEDSQSYFAIDVVNALEKRVEELTGLVEKLYGLED